MSYLSFYYNIENSIEFVDWEAFDVLCVSIEVATEVSEDCEMGMYGCSISFEDFKIRFLNRQPKTNTLIVGDGMIKDCLNS